MAVSPKHEHLGDPRSQAVGSQAEVCPLPALPLSGDLEGRGGRGGGEGGEGGGGRGGRGGGGEGGLVVV